MKQALLAFCPIFILLCGQSCSEKAKKQSVDKVVMADKAPQKIKLIFDTDANNELDDQHALAYLLLNGDVFDLKGITVNATVNGKGIQGHYDEAERVMQLCNLKNALPLLKGAEGNFGTIVEDFDPNHYDGQEAVDFILRETQRDTLIVVAVGKLTNIALALKKDPTFAMRTKIVWLGSNYPEPGEYNQDNDTLSMNYVFNSPIPFEMVTVRYGQTSGTDAVAVTMDEINAKMPGLGPVATEPITGRHGGSFNTFGDYSMNLFEHIFDHINHEGSKNSRPLFDMAALAILKENEWAEQRSIPAPILIHNGWVDRPDNPRKIVLWENFDKEAILDDFFDTLAHPIPIVASQ